MAPALLLGVVVAAVFASLGAARFVVRPTAGFGNQLRAINAIDFLARGFNTSLTLDAWHFGPFFRLALANGSEPRADVPPVQADEHTPAALVCSQLRGNQRSLRFVGGSAPNFCGCFGSNRQTDQPLNLNAWLLANATFAASVPTVDVAIHFRTCVDCGWTWNAHTWEKNLRCVFDLLACRNETRFLRQRVFVAADSRAAATRLGNDLTRCGHEVLTNRDVCSHDEFVHSAQVASYDALRCVMHDWYALSRARHVIASGTTFSLTASVFRGGDGDAQRDKRYTVLYHRDINNGCHDMTPMF